MQWEIDGSLDANDRANTKYKQLLKQYEAPALDPAMDESLLDFMKRRKAELQ